MTTVAQPAPSRREQRRRRRGGVGSAIVGVIGELLITAGILIGLFVAWQLWWTDVEADRFQATVSEALDAELPESPVVVAKPSEGEIPVAEAPLDATTFGRLWVPRWDTGEPYSKPISEGTDRATVLDKLGIGHYEGTAMPGEVGNFALAGHRQSHGKPFYDITTLEVGDPLVVETAEAWYVYRVTDSLIVSPRQTDVIAPNPADPQAEATEASITLTTCHPLFSTRERYIVHGTLDSWVPRDAGRPAELSPEA
ncbi:class E sortase [Litorihabitans aurantiacus]|uniref:Class E sortase n=1 Tax=Litorihabitans aurantiacus TaxID=1930061 RepID=A0AA37XGP9_9MICO|nr:class E sortase [Litorihabitans aurantiacus]GMA33105.1 class E sortase [Litorihabitans aurantiacus]